MDLISPILEKFIHEISIGRMVEAYMLLHIIMHMLKPHLKKIEDRIAGLETAIRDGFKSGESRFDGLEKRVTILEILGE